MDKEKRPHVCTTCGKGFTRMADLNRHIANIHNKKNTLTVFTCNVCGVKSTNRADHTRHLQSHDNDDIMIIDDDDDIEISTPSRSGRRSSVDKPVDPYSKKDPDWQPSFDKPATRGKKETRKSIGGASNEKAAAAPVQSKSQGDESLTYCVAPGCQSRNGIAADGMMIVEMHPFPPKGRERLVWEKVTHTHALTEAQLRHARVCELHFEPDCYTIKRTVSKVGNNLKSTEDKRLKPGVYPTKFSVGGREKVAQRKETRTAEPPKAGPSPKPTQYVTRTKTGSVTPKSHVKQTPVAAVPAVTEAIKATPQAAGRQTMPTAGRQSTPTSSKAASKQAANRGLGIPTADNSTLGSKRSQVNSSLPFVDLHMECQDEPLSPAQIQAHNEAKRKYKRSQELIKAAKEDRLIFDEDGTPKILDKPLPPPQAPQTPAPPPPDPLTVTPPEVSVFPQHLMAAVPSQLGPTLSPNQIQRQCVTGPIGSPTSVVHAERSEEDGRESPDLMIVAETPAPRANSWLKGPPPQPHQHRAHCPVHGNNNGPTPLTLQKGPSPQQMRGPSPQQLRGQAPPSQASYENAFNLPNSTPVHGTSGLGIRLPPGWSTMPTQPKKVTTLTPPVEKSQPVTTRSTRNGGDIVKLAPNLSKALNESSQVQTRGSQEVSRKRSRKQLLDELEEPQDEKDMAAKQRKAEKEKEKEKEAPGGKWVPLDEYYYGKMEGNPTYVEKKEEFRFKCWYCFKMLYNNVATMMHIQGHIDSERQVNLDLSDLTQCKHCYKQFDTPFEMQTHIEKVHMNNANVLLCRICEKDHENRYNLTEHMRKSHNACEMPYHCQLCSFRSSMYSDVVDHFKKKHNSSAHMLCLYCLRVFQTRFVTQGWGQTSIYYNHLMKHQIKNCSKKCQLCKLIFLNTQDLKNHRINDHCANQKGVIGKRNKHGSSDQVMIKLTDTAPSDSKQPGGVKSLNVPAVRKVMEHQLSLPKGLGRAKCVECRKAMTTVDHFNKFIQCSMCRFATSCSFAYANHMMGFHAGQGGTTTPGPTSTDKALETKLFCVCGFSSLRGNKLALHLVSCSKSTCYKDPPPAPSTTEEFGHTWRRCYMLASGKELKDPRKKPDASLLDVLGLVKKDALAASRISRRDVTPPPPPVEMPEVKLTELPPRRPSLLRDSRKKSFKNILKGEGEMSTPEELMSGSGMEEYTDMFDEKKKEEEIKEGSKDGQKSSGSSVTDRKASQAKEKDDIEMTDVDKKDDKKTEAYVPAGSDSKSLVGDITGSGGKDSVDDVTKGEEKQDSSETPAKGENNDVDKGVEGTGKDAAECKNMEGEKKDEGEEDMITDAEVAKKSEEERLEDGQEKKESAASVQEDDEEKKEDGKWDNVEGEESQQTERPEKVSEEAEGKDSKPVNDESSENKDFADIDGKGEASVEDKEIDSSALEKTEDNVTCGSESKISDGQAAGNEEVDLLEDGNDLKPGDTVMEQAGEDNRDGAALGIEQEMDVELTDQGSKEDNKGMVQDEYDEVRLEEDLEPPKDPAVEPLEREEDVKEDASNDAVEAREEEGGVKEDVTEALEEEGGVKEDAAEALEEEGDVKEDAAEALEEEEGVKEDAAEALEEEEDVKEDATEALEEEEDVKEDAAEALEEEEEDVKEDAAEVLEEEGEDVKEYAAEALEEEEDVKEDAAEALEEEEGVKEDAAEALEEEEDVKEDAHEALEKQHDDASDDAAEASEEEHVVKEAEESEHGPESVEDFSPELSTEETRTDREDGGADVEEAENDQEDLPVLDKCVDDLGQVEFDAAPEVQKEPPEDISMDEGNNDTVTNEDKEEEKTKDDDKVNEENEANIEETKIGDVEKENGSKKSYATAPEDEGDYNMEDVDNNSVQNVGEDIAGDSDVGEGIAGDSEMGTKDSNPSLAAPVGESLSQQETSDSQKENPASSQLSATSLSSEYHSAQSEDENTQRTASLTSVNEGAAASVSSESLQSDGTERPRDREKEREREHFKERRDRSRERDHHRDGDRRSRSRDRDRHHDRDRYHQHHDRDRHRDRYYDNRDREYDRHRDHHREWHRDDYRHRDHRRYRDDRRGYY